MDDPWGSPWAEEIQHEAPIPLPKTQGDLGKETAVNAPVIVEEKVHDTWGTEDDGFGEWASLPAGDEVVGGTTGPEGASNGWEISHEGADQGLTNGALTGAVIPWDLTPTLHTGDIPKLSPTLPSGTPAILRQPSPDPWAAETPKIGTLSDIGQRPEDVQVEGDANTIAEPLTDPATLQVPEAKEPAVRDSTVVDVIEEHFVIDHPVDTLEVEDVVKGSNNKDVEIDHGSSRPSSSPSDHEEALPESPRTSLDDEPKRPPIPRKISSKIQELVEHFDGLAKPELEEEDIAGPSTTSQGAHQPIEDSDEDDGFDDDFGDFEEGQSEAGDAAEDRPVTPAPGSSSQVVEGVVSQTHITQALSRESPKPVTKKVYGRVHYQPNISSLDTIFPQKQEEEPERIFIPDVIPHDSFSTVEERKTWYRISRYGTMLKHKTGDDENYVRVNWAQSQMRSETLKIVARWMEEDRMSGRVVLGGGSKGSSLFGWNDPNAAPVPLASAFAEKPGKKKAPMQQPVQDEPEVPREWPKGLVRSRSSSKTRSPSKPRRRTSSKSKRNSEEIKAVPAPVASFGWNSQSDSTSNVPIALAPKLDTVPSKPPLLSRKLSAAKAPALSPIFSPTYTNGQDQQPSYLNGLSSLMQPATMPPAPVPAPSSVFGQDDDWGEMMSSPVETAPAFVPPLPPLKDLRHKKSQSLSGSFLNSSQPSSMIPAQPLSSQPGHGHRPTTSLDKISVSKTRPPTASNPDPFSMDIFDSIPTTSTSINSPQPTSMNNATPVTDSSNDPWATADFSFFDSPPAPSKSAFLPAKIPNPTSTKSVAFKSSPLKPAPAPTTRQANTKTVAFTATPSAPLKGHARSKSEAQQDRIVADIVKGLPDLSYMLRK